MPSLFLLRGLLYGRILCQLLPACRAVSHAACLSMTFSNSAVGRDRIMQFLTLSASPQLLAALGVSVTRTSPASTTSNPDD